MKLILNMKSYGLVILLIALVLLSSFALAGIDSSTAFFASYGCYKDGKCMSYPKGDPVVWINENCESCPEDCKCPGRMRCEPSNPRVMSGGCTGCYVDGQCDGYFGENCTNCPEDCSCDRLLLYQGRAGYECTGGFDGPYGDGCVPIEVDCDHDGGCDSHLGESCENCEQDCPCGEDEFCDPLHEWSSTFGCVDKSYSHDCAPNYEWSDAFGCVPKPTENETICNDGIDNDQDGYTDCFDTECYNTSECQKSISIMTSSDIIFADGLDEMDIEVVVLEGGSPVDGGSILLYMYVDNLYWAGEIGEPIPASGTVSGGQFLSKYKADEVLQLYESGREFMELEAEIIAEYTSLSGEVLRDEKSIIIKPPVTAEIKVIEAFQTLRKVKHIAGKKMVVMIGVQATDESFFSERENVLALMQLDIEGDSFEPKNVFTDVSLRTGTLEEWGRMVTDVEQHFDFFQVPQEDREEGAWRFYEFYVDPQNTSYKGDYTFKARIYITRMSDSGEVSITDLDRKGVIYDVLPSRKITVNIVPIGVGIWSRGLCDYCLKYMGLKNEDRTYRALDPRLRPPENREGFDQWVERRNACSAVDLRHAGYSFDGKLYYQDIRRLMDEPTWFGEACTKAVEDFFPNNPIEQICSRSMETPYTSSLRGGITNKEYYNNFARESAAFMVATFPVAEEDLEVNVYQVPFQPYSLDVQVSSVGHILSALKDAKKTGWNEFMVGMVPTAQTNSSNVDMSERTLLGINFGFEGYVNVVRNPSGTLIDIDNGGATVMAHEISHLYCAIDEGGRIGETSSDIVQELLCPRGDYAINANLGGDSKGTRTTDGFWVTKREFRGTSSTPAYTMMSKSPEVWDGHRWTTYALYTGIGKALGVFAEEPVYYGNGPMMLPIPQK